MNDAIDIEAVAALSAIGRPVRRKEDQRLLTGKGRFTDDFNMIGQIYAVMVRSPYPHARILQVDATRAKRMPGVLGVFSGRDCLADGLGPIPHSPVPSTRYDLKLTGPGGGAIFFGPQPLLPADRVRHVGEAVAMVVAETLPQALDAAEAVEVEYDDLPRVTSPRVRSCPARRRSGTKRRTMSSSTRCLATARRPTGPLPQPTMLSKWISTSAG